MALGSYTIVQKIIPAERSLTSPENKACLSIVMMLGTQEPAMPLRQKYIHQSLEVQGIKFKKDSFNEGSPK
eukprot:12510102-Ditylum_brightwellii.AAC.1